MKKANTKVNVAKLKNELSKYLRLVQKGEKITVMDRNEPIAEIVPLSTKKKNWYDDLVAQGKMRLPIRPPQDIYISAVELIGTTREEVMADFFKDREDRF